MLYFFCCQALEARSTVNIGSTIAWWQSRPIVQHLDEFRVRAATVQPPALIRNASVMPPNDRRYSVSRCNSRPLLCPGLAGRHFGPARQGGVCTKTILFNHEQRA